MSRTTGQLDHLPLRNKNSFERDSPGSQAGPTWSSGGSAPDWPVAFIGQEPKDLHKVYCTKGPMFALKLHSGECSGWHVGQRGIPLDGFLVHSQQEDQLCWRIRNHSLKAHSFYQTTFSKGIFLCLDKEISTAVKIPFCWKPLTYFWITASFYGWSEWIRGNRMARRVQWTPNNFEIYDLHLIIPPWSEGKFPNSWFSC